MATYSKAQLVKAIKAQCNDCNDVHGGWNESNDCTGVSCKLYPFRPGNGPGHAHTPIVGRKGNPEAFRARRGVEKDGPNSVPGKKREEY